MASNYLVENELWFLWDAPEYRRAWIQKKAVKPTIAKHKLTKRKSMVLIAFTCKPKRFSVTVLPQGKSVDAQFMINYLKDTGKRFHNSHCKNCTSRWTSRPAHSSRNKAVPGPEGVPLVSQSPFSPDLNLLDRFLFRYIKMDLRGEDFSGPEDLSKAIQRSIRHISENTLVEELKKLESHLDDVIASAVNYISQIHEKFIFILYITVFYLCTCNHYRMPYYYLI